MAYRLIFTSAPRGLTGGRTGFCTVARSRNMSDKLAAMVEKCGVYDHERNMGFPVFSHKKIFFAGHRYHVLSRLAEAAPDYTNRSNYLAEHVVISDMELTGLPSPAEVILNKGDWLEKWEGEPAWLEDITIQKAKPAYCPPAKIWQASFADAGKAALLSESAPLIFAHPKDSALLLKLFAESAALHGTGSRAWDFTFTTSISESENPADYNWRVVSNPTDGRMQAAPAAINLITKTAPHVERSPLAEYARTGLISNRDRLGLKVGVPADIAPKIHVASNRKKKEFPLVPILAASFASTIGLLLLVFFYDPAPSEDFNDFAPSSAAAGAYPSTSANVTNTYSKVMETARDFLARNDWHNALETWDNAQMDALNPRGRTELLSEIGKRVDKLMDDAESVSNRPFAGKDDISAASANLKTASTAFNLDGLPKKEERLQRWQKLERLIKRL